VQEKMQEKMPEKVPDLFSNKERFSPKNSHVRMTS